MKKLIFAGLLCAMVCVCAPGAAGTVLNVDLPKETLTEREAADRHISTRPEGFKVTRQSVIPWDDAGEQWSILVEMENVSEEAIIIDDTWLIACNAQKEEQALECACDRRRVLENGQNGAAGRTGGALRGNG